jgi:hypothetical protein
LALYTKFKESSTLDVEESDEHFLHLWFRHAISVRSWVCHLFTSQTLLFALGIILKAPCFISSDFVLQKLLIDCIYRNTHQHAETYKPTRPISATNFNTTGGSALKPQLMQAEICTDMSLLRSSRMAPSKSHDKIIPGTLQPHFFLAPNVVCQFQSVVPLILSGTWCADAFKSYISTSWNRITVGSSESRPQMTLSVVDMKWLPSGYIG